MAERVAAQSQPQPPLTKVDITGACHCKTIRFIVRGVDLSGAKRCNCSSCNTWGYLSVQVQPGNLSLLSDDGAEKVANFSQLSKERPSDLVQYNISGTDKPDHIACWYHCGRCGTKLFLSGSIKVAGGEVMTVNMRTLDLTTAGIDGTSITEPSLSTYCDGRSGTFATRIGEPYSPGFW